MKAQVTYTNLGGSPKAYSDRGSSGVPLAKGRSITLDVADAPELAEGSTPQEFAKAMVGHASAAPAVGGNSGKVRATAVGGNLVIRQYVDVNAFLDSDKDDYRDHKVKAGSSIEADLTSSNKTTLIVMDIF